MIHRLDESSNESSIEVQRLRRELVEKENRIKELEARETYFTQEMDRIQCNMDELEEQLESYYSRCNPPPVGTNEPKASSSGSCPSEQHSRSGISQSETPESIPSSSSSVEDYPAL